MLSVTASTILEVQRSDCAFIASSARTVRAPSRFPASATRSVCSARVSTGESPIWSSRPSAPSRRLHQTHSLQLPKLRIDPALLNSDPAFLDRCDDTNHHMGGMRMNSSPTARRGHARPPPSRHAQCVRLQRRGVSHIRLLESYAHHPRACDAPRRSPCGAMTDI